MQEKLTLTIKEAASITGVSLPIMYSLTERQDFTALIRIGRKKLILKRKFLEWLEEQTTGHDLGDAL
jgi:excisionase family DNA binding protein